MNPDFSGYTMITEFRKLSNKKAKRRSGGLVCYIKYGGIQQVKGSGKNEERLWVKCKACHFGLPRDLFLSTLCLQPLLIFPQEKVCGIYLTMRLHCIQKKGTLI